MSSLSDQSQREKALDPHHSFIVQAPAGSGKTELLVQRFLCLLKTVKNPEEIIAITFTRKAAAEMRERVLNALGEVENPNRLRILTIDSLCVSLTQQMPIMAKFGAQPSVVDDPQELYREAARALLYLLESDEPWVNHLEKLLLHLDNNFEIVENLFVDMLSHREQWLPYIFHAKNQLQLRTILEGSLANIIQTTIKKCRKAFPAEYLTLVSHAAIETQEEWLGVANLLLTKDYQWRKRLKKDLSSLIEKLSHDETLRQCLQDILQSPPPNYTHYQWEIIDALIELLPLLAAQLKIIFQQKGAVDFSEISSAALTALGNPETPTDLALKLDYQIQHILVDEFQDTSLIQFRLLEALTSGWQNNDGRTLFLVGDPMQSIYRFRQAEVGLFLAVKKNGLQHIKLTSLKLNTNFRSTPLLIDWLNNTFTSIFPKEENIVNGAISFSSCVAIENPEDLTHSAHPAVTLYTEQSEKIIDTIKTLRSSFPDETIAILVRSRTHLAEIIPALKAAGLKFKGVELDRLSDCTVIHDLFALTRALLHPADRIAWLAILRTPWCGLTLADLHRLAHKDLECPLWQLLKNEMLVKEISPENKPRLNYFINTLTSSLESLGRQSLRQLVETTWIALSGPACLNNEVELSYAKLYFDLIEKIPPDSTDGLSWLEKNLSTMFAPLDPEAEDKLQIMTIHKAKGLEFDHVILPCLERQPHADKHRLLTWLENPKEEGESELILAPIKSVAQQEDSIYHYVRLQEKKKQEYETARLLYVACTRAKKTLHLFGEIKMDKNNQPKESASTSFLHLLWPTFAMHDIQNKRPEKKQKIPSIPTLRYFTRLKDRFFIFDKKEAIILSQSNPFPQDSMDTLIAQAVGTVIHKCLQRISQENLEKWDNQKIKSQYSLWKKQLLQLGLPQKFVEEKIMLIEEAITKTLNDPRGQWILYPHSAARSEFPLTLSQDNKITHLIIDRTFIDKDNIRWIIDYKTSSTQHSFIESFLDQEQAHYETQLITYAKAMQHLSNEKIKLGLYFPLLGGWREWTY